MSSLTTHYVDSAAITGLGALTVKRAEVTLDESWMPYCQATLTCSPPTAFAGKAVDPRLGHRCTFRLVRDTDLTRPGTQLEVRSFDLTVRKRTVDDRTGELVLSLASDEALLEDWRWTQAYIYRANIGQARAAVALALQQISATLTAGTADAVIDPAASDFPPGVSGWDYCQPLALMGDLRLWCSEARAWRLDPASAIVANTGVQLSTSSTITQLSDSIDRDGDWFDACAITYSWTDNNNAQRLGYDIWPASGTGFKRCQAISYATAKPGTGVAQVTAGRTATRGRGVSFDAISRYDVAPSTAVQVTATDGTTLSGVLRSVSWLIDTEGESSDLMAVTTRDLIAAPLRSWLSVPTGRRWTDVPAGPWTTYTP